MLSITVLPEVLSPEDITVPDVTNMDVDEARSLLQEEGFTIGEEIEQNNDEVSAGQVIRTEPRAGKTQKEGTAVNIYESIGKERYSMDDFTGRLYSEIEEMLKEEGFQSIKAEEEYSEETKGTILEQNIDSGEEVIPQEEELVFVVSRGEEPLELKDLTGYNDKALEEYRAATGLNIEVAGEEHHAEIAQGEVIRQEPAAGESLNEGDTVKVYLSNGPEQLPVEVKREVNVPYKPEPDKVGQPQEVQIFIEDMDNNIDEPFNTIHITEDRVISFSLQIQPGETASYQIMRDGQMIIQENVPYEQ